MAKEKGVPRVIENEETKGPVRMNLGNGPRTPAEKVGLSFQNGKFKAVPKTGPKGPAGRKAFKLRSEEILKNYDHQLRELTGKGLDEADPVVTLLLISVDPEVHVYTRMQAAAKAAPYVRPKMRDIDLNILLEQDQIAFDEKLQVLQQMVNLAGGDDAPARGGPITGGVSRLRSNPADD